MNNYRLLNIVNPQFVYNLNCGQDKNNGKYMVVIPALVGYDKNVACSIYLTISEKLLDPSTNEKLEQLINEMQEDLSVLLRGYEDFVPGIDYFLSESLYEYVKTEPDDDSSDIDPEPEPGPEPDPGPDDPGDDSYCFDMTGIVILHGKDVNRLININRYNINRVSQILALEEREKRNRKRVLRMSQSYDLWDNELSDDEIDEIDDDLYSTIVMNDYVLYDTDLNFTQDTESYKYLYDINNKDMRNLEWFYRMNNLENYEFSSAELCNIPKTFFTIINDNAMVQNPETIKNQIYDKIVKYYANGGWDDASINLNLLFNSVVSTTLPSTRINCGCNDTVKDGSINADGITVNNCIDLYNNAILEWLKNMLGDDEFYKDWFFTIITGACPEPNSSMIDALIKLLQEYVDNNLGGGPNGNKFNPNKRYNVFDHMKCCDRGTYNNEYYDIIINYIKVLNAVKNNEIDENRNMIKIYGEQFAQILPYLTC